MPNQTFSIITLGCFRNAYDSSVISGKYRQQGLVYLPNFFGSLKEKSNQKKKCQLLIINTCGFIEAAKKESLSIIRAAVDLKNTNLVERLAVCGCLVKRYREELEKSFPEVDLWQDVIANEDIGPRFFSFKPSSCAFLKIAEGCFNNCSYCAIPLIKGSLCSRSLSDILAEARLLDQNNVKELNIIGQDITSWGKDIDLEMDLTVLLKRLLKETKSIPWIRLLYAHPRHISDSLIELIAAEERICKYIDIPIQHINDRILKLMNRDFGRKKIEQLILTIRKKIPGCVLRTSVIVGFPGETEREFAQLKCFLRDMPFERLGAFAYSREEGTKAYALKGQIHHATKTRRLREIMTLQKNISGDFNKTLVGQSIDVLIENRDKGYFYGRGRYDAPEVDGGVFVRRKGLRLGEIHRVKIVDAWEYDLVGV